VLARTGADPTLVPALVAAYRARYQDTCVAETPAFPGVAALLATLTARFRLGVVTSKPTVFAVPILTALDLARHFAVIEGPSLESRAEPKTITLGRALAALGTPDVRTVAIVGDRAHDVVAGRAHGVRTIGVLWGIGARAELEQAGADRIAATIAQLSGALDR
jgi:phosphoglycolate phosphatase